jgi:putative ABC transport system substrate-binding protein
MERRAFIAAVTGGLLAAPLAAGAQQARVYRVGVILQGGPYLGAVDGLRKGLGELGLEEGKQFYAGTDPVALGLVESFRKPGGRLTGVYGRLPDLTPKRLELLKEMVPRLRRVVMFYDPNNRAAQRDIKLARDAARQLKVELVEHRVGSVEELRAGLRALRAEETDALLSGVDAMVIGETALVIDTARAKKLPTMFTELDSVVKGGLASYGVSYSTMGRLSARYVQRLLLGARPGDLPVEQVDRLYFVVNLKTAKALGLTIPQSLLLRADEVIH